MKLLSRLAACSTTVLLTAVALAGTAYARVPPEVPDRPPRAAPGTEAGNPTTVDVVTGSGLSALQVVLLMLCAAVVATAITAFVARRLPPARSYAAGRVG